MPPILLIDEVEGMLAPLVIAVFGVELRRLLFYVYRRSQTVRLGYIWQWVTDRLARADVDIEEHFWSWTVAWPPTMSGFTHVLVLFCE